MGHVSPAMMKTYSHIRRKALDEAAQPLEPAFKLRFPMHEGVRSRKKDRERGVMSQVTSQPVDQATRPGRIPKETGTPKGDLAEVKA